MVHYRNHTRNANEVPSIDASGTFINCAIIRLKIFSVMNILSLITSHDASVTYISDGKLKYFAKEERLSGYKHDKGFTKCLDYIIKNEFKVDLAVLNSTCLLYTSPSPRD